MSKLPRVTLVPFGSTGTTDDFETFGSTAGGGPAYSKDIAAIQATAAWLTGWRAALVAAKAPVLQDMNGKMLVDSYMMAYLMQQGIPEYDSGTTYFIGSLVMKTGTSEMYMSAVDTNAGNALPTRVSDANWTYLGLLGSVYQMARYRRPNLVWASGTTATLETGLSGTSGQGLILFPDGVSIADSTSGHLVLDMTRVASLGGSPQSGLRTGTVANNTWYAVYAVKANSGAAFVLVADTVLPIQANYATLNANFGTNGWVYLGMVRNGDNGGTATGLLKFRQCGAEMIFTNVGSGETIPGLTGCGIHFIGTVAATITYAYAAGGGAAQIPNHIGHATYTVAIAATDSFSVQDAAATYYIAAAYSNGDTAIRVKNDAAAGLHAFDQGGGTVGWDLWLSGFTDLALGVGSNPVI